MNIFATFNQLITHIMTRLLFIACIICVFGQQAQGQIFNNIKHVDATCERLIKPRMPLPDSIRNYSVKATVLNANGINGFTESYVAKSITIPSLQRATTGGDLLIQIEVDKCQSRSKIEEFKKDSVTTLYRYIVEIIPVIDAVVTDKSGHIYFEKVYDKSTNYASQYFKTKKEVEINIPLMAIDINKTVVEAHNSGLGAINDLIQESYSFLPDRIRFFYDNEVSIEAYSVAIDNIKKAMSALKYDATLLQQQTDFFDKERNSQDLNTKIGKRMHAISTLNLVQLYRCADNYPKAWALADELIQKDVSQIKSITAELHKSQTNFDEFQYYKKNRTVRTSSDPKVRLQPLQIQGISEGYIILKNNPVPVHGEVIDFLGNIDSHKIKMKYQKTLQDEVKDIEYNLPDVDEIHLDGWHFKVFNYSNRLHVGEIRYKSSNLMLFRDIPLNLENSTNWNNIWSGTDFMELNQQIINMSILNRIRFDDCDIINNRLGYGYYSDALLVAKDYDNTCINRPTSETAQNAPVTTKKRSNQRNTATIGMSFGANNFSGIVGLDGSVRLYGRTYARFGVGYSNWGLKTAAGLRYNFKRNMAGRNGWSMNAAVAHHTGRSAPFNISYQTEDKEQIDFDIKRHKMNTLHLTMQYNISFSRKSSMAIEFGGAFSLSKRPYTRLTPTTLTDDAVKRAISTWQPGGVVFGLIFNRHI
jgi:hypothetical protein